MKPLILIFGLILIGAVSDTVWQAVIGAVVAMFLGYMQYLTNRKVDAGNKEAKVASAVALVEAKKAATKVEEVKDTLDTATKTSDAKLEEVKVVAIETKALVNSASLIQLKLHAVTAKRLAEITKDERDMNASALADKAVQEHEEKQRVADSEAKALKEKGK